jgi:poly(3-hydroxybutyrate) depolymerase
VVFYTIEGGTHGWPGPDQDPPMSELQASSVIAAFFGRQIAR